LSLKLNKHTIHFFYNEVSINLFVNHVEVSLGDISGKLSYL
jgi:hypothetical protein